MDVRRALGACTRSLERLVAAASAAEFEATWNLTRFPRVARETLALARRAGSDALEPALADLDARLLAALRRANGFGDLHVATFHVPELERLQHAAAAALVAARWGVAGLRTVIDDAAAPLARRYFAFLALAERHPWDAWPLFARYLRTRGAHHAFVAAAVEAARYYPAAAPELVALFERVRRDEMLRRFLAPRILESLYVLGDPRTRAFLEALCVAGHTDPDPERCEVTRALVALRKLTGAVAPSVKYADPAATAVRQSLDRAERRFEAERHRLTPVRVI